MRGWKDILWRTYEQVGEHRLLAVAAGVVFYGLLAVFPAVTTLVSLYGLFASPSAISDQLSLAAGILPQGAVDILREQINRLTSGNSAKLGLGFIFGLAVALWSSNAGTKAIMDALNVVYEEKEKRSFVKLNLVSLAFTLGGIGSLLVALGAVVILPVALNYLGLQNVTDLLIRAPENVLPAPAGYLPRYLRVTAAAPFVRVCLLYGPRLVAAAGRAESACCGAASVSRAVNASNLASDHHPDEDGQA